jgi:hypothetical protein
MKVRTIAAIWLVCLLASAPAAFSRSECMKVLQPPLSPFGIPNLGQLSAPLVLSYGGDTTWVQVHADGNSCPGDPNLGHGGEATGGPGPLETWCFEEGPGDTCGTNPPWTTNCFTHVDVRSLPSQTGVNFWHTDTYRADQRTYCGSYALWCGSAALWQGKPVECGTWQNPPGYGKQWNSHVQLALPSSFNVANGCTLYFDPRYDTECKYDYFYVDYWNGTQWKTLATFNATSNNPGGICGAPSKPNPDYFGNTDVNRLTNCNWQGRTDPNQPAFKAVISPASLIITSGPKFRWRFTSDGGWDDMDGSGNTDGGAFIDNVWVRGDTGQFVEDFETGVLNPAYWSLPNPPGVLDGWHIAHDPDPPYEGGDGGTRATCWLDSSFVYRARPEQGYPSGVPWRNGWYYRLMSPRVPMLNGGCVVQYDEYVCARDVTCDYTSLKVRYYDPASQTWCPWGGESSWPCGTDCYFWHSNTGRNASAYIASGADSMQYAWEIQDSSAPGDVCLGKHTGTEFQVDNVSIGFYDLNATYFYARGLDLLHDTFFTTICAYNSLFDAYDPDTLAWYSGPSAHTLPKYSQLYLDVSDSDHLAAVELKGSLDGGATWATKSMQLDRANDPQDPTLGGYYFATFCPSDFGVSEWVEGTEVWYYVKATDALGHAGYFPARANPGHPTHTGNREDYLEFSVLPLFPETYEGTKILLVDGHNRRLYDWSPCLSDLSRQVPLEDIYEQTLTDAGYCSDKYDISGAGSNAQIHPVWFDDYDAVVWFTGPYFSNYLFWAEAQRAIRDYLGDGGKVVLCGDRIAFDMAPTSQGGNGEDSLGGEFLSGIMGSTYLGEMPYGTGYFSYPYAYAVAAESVNVFGAPVAIDLDTLLVYRECPYLKDMSYVLAKAAPPTGYTAQRLMRVANPTVAQADEVIYTEYQGIGQCVYVNFDLSASVNHIVGYCDGSTPSPAPDFNAGQYDGRVELMRVILEDIFGLAPTGGGVADIPGPAVPTYQWTLAQNQPNPVTAATEIRYAVARPGSVRLAVYSATGQVVRTLVNEAKQPGEYLVTWDGRNSRGEPVSSGVYFYKMDAGDYKATKKMLLIH